MQAIALAPALEALERGELLHFPTAPFPLPAGEDLQFLLAQRLAGIAHKAISFDPNSGRCCGNAGVERTRTATLLAAFGQGVVRWLTEVFPSYAAHARADRVSFRPEEEATRRLRFRARNDLLHIDAFPNRPSSGDRILRVFANVHPTDSRVWATSEPFAVLLEKYGAAAGLPGKQGGSWLHHLGRGVLDALRSPGRPRCAYDHFMLRFHDYLKGCEEFQERSRKRLWHLPPNSAWMAFTDACSYAELRGQFAVEHSFFISPRGLLYPHLAPAALLDDFCRRPHERRAA